MAYATVEDVQNRMIRTLSDREVEVCEQLLEDAALIIYSCSPNSDEEIKKNVSCSMVRRILDSGDGIPIGATQGSMSALGYSQSVTFGSGGSGELYLSKLEKKMLGVGNRIGARSPLERGCRHD